MMPHPGGPMGLLLSLVAASLAAAPALHAGDHADLVPVDGRFGHDTLWQSYLRYFEPELLPADDAPPAMCATSLLAAMEAEWDAFSAPEQERILARVAPGVGAIHPRVPERSPPVAWSAAPPPPQEACFGEEAYGKAQVLKGTHFQLEYQANTISADVAADLLVELDATYELQVGQLGWRVPTGSDRWLIPFYVVPGNQASAFTTIYGCGGQQVPYIVAYSGSFFDDRWWRSMAAHEFNHAAQWGYGYAIEFWWWEATATYMQEYAHPDLDEWAPYITGYTDQPYVSLSASDTADLDVFWHMYGMAIWNFWIDENYGGLPTILAMWDASQGAPGMNYGLTQGEMMEDVGLDFDQVYAGFVAANTVMDYRERAEMPDVDLEDTVNDLPADGASGLDAPQAYGQNYWRFDLRKPTGDRTDLEVVFTGDEPANWLVQLVGASADQVETVVEMEVDGTAGTARLEGYGDYEQVFLVVSPRKETTGTFGFSWSAKGEPSLGTEDADAAEAADELAALDGDTLESGGCGCDTSAPASVGWLGALGAVAVARRRRGIPA